MIDSAGLAVGSTGRRRPTSFHTRFSATLRDSSPRRILTVSELTGLVRASVESGFSDVWVEGEVSNLRAPGSGHLYCTLKDDTCQIRAVIFRSTASRLRFALEDGLCLVTRGKVTVYEPRGEYQIVLEYAEPKGLGALQLAFEQLKQRLTAEGLFDPARKRPLPYLPRTVGLVTSPTGSVVRDMITVLHRRCPNLGILVVPVAVQGEGSVEQIVEGIQALNDLELADVIIVGRGGGSLEDLWSFNDERVVRAIAASRLPIVSAVGHETDVTLADFAADMRAPTPSAAAEAAVPVLSEVLNRLGELDNRCRQAMVRRCADERRRLALCFAHLARLRFTLLAAAQHVDGAVLQMAQALRNLVKRRREQVHAATHGLIAASPQARVHHGLTFMPHLFARLCKVMGHQLDRRRREVEACMDHLHHLSPLAILSRGYSIVESLPDRRVIHEARQVEIGQDVLARLAQGQLRCTVRETISDPSV